MKKFFNDYMKQPLIMYCVLYTCITLINSILYLVNGTYHDPSGNWHEIDRAIILAIGILAYVLATKLPIKNLFIRAITVYIPTLILVYVYVFLTGLREPLAQSAYIDITVNYTGLFIIVLVVILIGNKIKRK